MPDSLQQRLEQLRLVHGDRHDTLNQALQNILDERKNIQEQISRLTQHLNQLAAREESIRTELADTRFKQHFDEAELALEALNASYQSIDRAEDYLLQHDRLQTEWQSIVSQDPEAETRLNELRNFSQELKELENSKSYPTLRRRLREAYEQDRQRLAPLLKNEKERNLLQPDEPIALTTLSFSTPDIRESIWVLPFPPNSEKISASFARVLENIAQKMQFALHTNANIVEQSNWVGHLAFRVASGNDRHNHLQEMMRIWHEHLQGAYFPSDFMSINTLELPYETWLLGEDSSPNATLSTEKEFDTETLESLAERSDGWYSNEDIVSWERELTLSESSRWNEQGRRLRTILLRLLAQGYVGTKAVPALHLWRPLPEPHRTLVRDGLEAMISHGILQTNDVDDLQHIGITVAPEMLEKVQDLINRDVTDFWMEILTGAPLRGAA